MGSRSSDGWDQIPRWAFCTTLEFWVPRENRAPPSVKVPGSSRVPRRGDVELRSYLQDAVGRRSLVFDLSMTHDRFGSSSHVQQNGLLLHPQDLDAPLRLAAQRKINSYRQQYADNQNISFLPAIVSTSTRMHGEFLRLLFLIFHRPTGRPRSTSLPLE